MAAKAAYLLLPAQSEGRFLYLLVSLLLLFVVYPFFQGKPVGVILLDVFVLFILAAGIYTVVNKKALLIIFHRVLNLLWPRQTQEA